MKKLVILFVLVCFFNVGCATSAIYKNEDALENGARVKIGSNQGAKIGDKIDVYENVCSSIATRAPCKSIKVGVLTLVEVSEDQSVGTRDMPFVLKDGFILKLVKSK